MISPARFFIILFLPIIWASCQHEIPEEVRKEMLEIEGNLSYNEDIRPILADRCFVCHGPDISTRKAGLRLDIQEDAYSILQSRNGRAIVAGKISRSELSHRILSDIKDMQMPPAESNMTLSPEEKAILLKWIDQGATYEEHWAFIPPRKPEIPNLPTEMKTFNDIDHFISARLLKENLEQSPIAQKERLLRRVTMDLTGLPPTIEEIDSFLNDEDENAYEKVVDRLFRSEAFGERMAMEWMDVSRYADSHGLHADGFRLMWPWRDWVINAFNSNLSYKDFASWQIAGDMMPNATFDQKLATAFNRNHTMTAEGGVIDEEFRLSYVFDRTETFSTVFLGLGAGCARCHDHKFDPISQKEYYELTAFFNNVKELGMTGDDGNYGPLLPIISIDKAEFLNEINNKINQGRKKVELAESSIKEIKSFIEGQNIKENINNRVFYGKLDVINGKELDGNKSFVSRTTTAIEEGYIGNSARFTGEYDEVYITDIDCFDAFEPFTAGLWINTTKRDSTETQSLLCTAGEKNSFWRGWDFYLDEENRLNLKLIHSLPSNYLHVRTIDSIPVKNWTHTAFTYEGTSSADGVNLFIDGMKARSENVFDNLYKTIHPVYAGNHKIHYQKPIRVAKSYRAFTGEYGVFKGLIDEIKLYNADLSPLEVKLMASPGHSNFSEEEMAVHFTHYNNSRRAALNELRKAVKEKIIGFKDVDEVMIMEEMKESRQAFVYNRGEYTQPTEKVYPQTPKVLHKFPEHVKKNRLGLAEWLFSEDNPLTDRVTVNRYWQMIFGNGLVESSSDFGLQGSRPSHPELLDYLSISFRENDRDLKWLLKKMVMSYTYQQSSNINEKQKEKDPRNILLSRGPSYRLQAEMIRDNVLAASGILKRNMGGESVKPYQPEGLWIEKSSFSHQLLNYEADSGDSLYRRSLYTFIRRTSPHPAMTIFDAPNRETCTIKRENTNTPLQALVLLNDPQFVEASRIMAERIQIEAGESLTNQIQYAFRLSTGRRATSEELGLMIDLYDAQYEHFIKNKEEAKALLSVGEFRRISELEESKTAALASVTSMIINHNETYMKR